MVEKVLSDFQDSQLEDGTFPFVFPSNYEHPQFNIKIPEWDLHYVTLLWKEYYTYGDVAILERYYDSARKMLMYYIETLDETTGLIPKDKEWHISDWPYPNINQEGPFLTAQNCKIYHDLNLTAKIASRLEIERDCEEYLKISDEFKDAIQEYLHNPKKRLFRYNYAI